MGQLRDIESQLEEAGFHLLAIAPDRPEKVRETAEKYKIRGLFLSDNSMAAARAFRIAYEVDAATLGQLANSGIDLEAASGERHHQLPVPAVYVTRRNGIILFSYASPDYKVRLDPGLLIAAVRTAQK